MRFLDSKNLQGTIANDQNPCTFLVTLDKLAKRCLDDTDVLPEELPCPNKVRICGAPGSVTTGRLRLSGRRRNGLDTSDVQDGLHRDRSK